MRIVIAGGGGLLGRILSAPLAAEGHEVVVLSRSPGRIRGLPPGARAEAWDGRTATGWAPLVDGAGAVVNLTGENLAGGRWTEARKRRLRASRIEPGLALAQAIEQAREKPRVLLQASAIGYYGPRGEAVIDESTPAGSDFLARLCQDWEATTEPVEGMGVRRVVVRSAPVLAKNAVMLRLMSLPFYFFVGGPVAGGRHWFSWIHHADESGAMRFLLANETAHGPFNLAAPEPVRNASFARALGAALHRPSWFPTPGFLVRLVFGEMAEMVLGSLAEGRAPATAGAGFCLPLRRTRACPAGRAGLSVRPSRRWFWLIPVVVVLALGGGLVWASLAAQPTARALAALRSDGQVQVESGQWLVFRPASPPVPTTGLIFYPGGRVDYRAYAPPPRDIAAQGFLVVDTPMPFNLAVLAPDRAAEVMSAYPQVKAWAVGGHSLGGSMAARFVHSHPGSVQGLVLWASYPDVSDDLSGFNLPVASVSGSRDGLATLAKIADTRRLLPPSTRFLVVEGGNHAQFGAYRPQPGDNPPEVSPEARQAQTVTAAAAELLRRVGR